MENGIEYSQNVNNANKLTYYIRSDYRREAGGFYVYGIIQYMEMKMVNDFMLEFIVIWELGGNLGITFCYFAYYRREK